MASQSYDLMLQEFPLMISPFYKPPHQVSLPSNYRLLPDQLPISIYYSNYSSISPQATEKCIRENSVINDINTWKKEISKFKESIVEDHKTDKLAYNEWVNENINHYAPGYLNSDQNLLRPKQLVSEKAKQSIENNSSDGSSSISQLSEVFQNIQLK